MRQVLQHIEHLMRTKGHCVIVVAEGCGDTLIQSSGEKDAGTFVWPDLSQGISDGKMLYCVILADLHLDHCINLYRDHVEI